MLKRVACAKPLIQSSPLAEEVIIKCKRRRNCLFITFDDGPELERDLLELLNLKLSSTLHRHITLSLDECTDRGCEQVGAFVYFSQGTLTDFVWRRFLVSHTLCKRLGNKIHIRTCGKSQKRLQEEDEQEATERRHESDRFASSPAPEMCVIIPVYDQSASNLLCLGTAIVTAMELNNEPLYFRKGCSQRWELYADQESHKMEATLKIERVNSTVGLYELSGIKWRKMENL